MMTSPNAPAVRTILISAVSPSETVRGLTSYTNITPDNLNTATGYIIKYYNMVTCDIVTLVYLFYACMSN